MEEEKNEEMQEENQEETQEETSEDNREEETSDEIRDNDYVNDDEIEMLRKIEERLNDFDDKFNAISEKMENVLSMIVDSGAIIQDSVEDVSEAERKDYEEDFINIDEMDLSL